MGIFFKDVPTREPDVPSIIGPLFKDKTTRVPTKFGQFAKNWLLPMLQSGLEAAREATPLQPGQDLFSGVSQDLLRAQQRRDMQSRQAYLDALQERRVAADEARQKQVRPEGAPFKAVDESGAEVFVQRYSDGSTRLVEGFRPLPRPTGTAKSPSVRNIGGVPHIFDEEAGVFNEAQVTDPLSRPVGPPIPQVEFGPFAGGEVPVEGMPAPATLLPMPRSAGLNIPRPVPRRPTIPASEASRILTPPKKPSGADTERDRKNRLRENTGKVAREALSLSNGDPVAAVERLQQALLDSGADPELVNEAIRFIRTAHRDKFQEIIGFTFPVN